MHLVYFDNKLDVQKGSSRGAGFGISTCAFAHAHTHTETVYMYCIYTHTHTKCLCLYIYMYGCTYEYVSVGGQKTPVSERDIEKRRQLNLYPPPRRQREDRLQSTSRRCLLDQHDRLLLQGPALCRASWLRRPVSAPLPRLL